MFSAFQITYYWYIYIYIYIQEIDSTMSNMSPIVVNAQTGNLIFSVFYVTDHR